MTVECSPLSRPRPSAASWLSAPAGLANAQAGDGAGVGLNHHMSLESVLTAGQRLMHVAGVGIDGGDHPIRSDALGDPSATIGAIRAFGSATASAPREPGC